MPTQDRTPTPRFFFFKWLYLDSGNKGCARLGGKVVLPLEVVKEKWPSWSSCPLVLLRRLRHGAPRCFLFFF